jgi:hypothetical protein
VKKRRENLALLMADTRYMDAETRVWYYGQCKIILSEIRAPTASIEPSTTAPSVTSTLPVCSAITEVPSTPAEDDPAD